MRWLIGFVLVLAAVGAVRLVGCGETTGTGGSGGDGGVGGDGGSAGVGGGGAGGDGGNGGNGGNGGSVGPSGWFRQNPIPQGRHLFSVSFADASTGTAVGDVRDRSCGRRTVGTTWTVQNSGTTDRLFSTCRSPMRTPGPPWASAREDPANEGRRSRRGPCRIAAPRNSLFGVSFADAETTGRPWAATGPSCGRSDGGTDVDRWSSGAGTTRISHAACRLPLRTPGTAVGKFGTIVRTTDGGKRRGWSSDSRHHATASMAVSFTDANAGTAVGEYGTIVRTTDGGATWTEAG